MSTTENKAQFTIDVKGEVSLKPWKGVFTCKLRLSHGEQLREDMLYRELLGGTNPEFASPRARNQAAIFATIHTHLLSTPKWWEVHDNGLGLEDDRVVKAVYDNILKAKKEAREALLKEAGVAAEDLEKDEQSA